MANDCPITSKRCRGAVVFDHCPLKCTASTRSAPISRSGRDGTGWESMPSTNQRPHTGARNHADWNTFFFEDLENSNVRDAAREASAQGDTDGRHALRLDHVQRAG